MKMSQLRHAFRGLFGWKWAPQTRVASGEFDYAGTRRAFGGCRIDFGAKNKACTARLHDQLGVSVPSVRSFNNQGDLQYKLAGRFVGSYHNSRLSDP